MPNIESLKEKSFTRNSRDNFLNVRHGDIFHRKDLRDGFGYILTGITVSLAIAGVIYVVGKKLTA